MSQSGANLTATKRAGLSALCIASLLTASVATASAQQKTAATLDAAALVSIESIDAQTDVTVFLRSDVPAGLRLAALRRAWTVDPAIRDFRGLQESDWNFNDPNSILGFGEIGPETDVRQMVAELLTEVPRPATRQPKTLRAILAAFRIF